MLIRIDLSEFHSQFLQQQLQAWPTREQTSEEVQTGIINAAGLDDTDVALWTDACDRQLYVACQAWNLPYTPVVFYANPDNLPVADGRVQLLTIVPSLDIPGAAGIHQNYFGLIFSRIEPHGDQTPIEMSHEILEARVNPYLTGWVEMPDGRRVAKEIADPVEELSYGESAQLGPNIKRVVPVSNYVLPSYFDPNGKYPFDRMGKLTAPFSLTPGGYYVVEDAAGTRSSVFAARARELRRESRGSRLVR